MKYLKISVRSKPGQTEMVYPVRYQEEIGPFSQDYLYYDVDGELKLLLCIPDADFKQSMIRKDVEEVTEAEVQAISNVHEPKTEVITDEAKIRRIEIKSRLGKTLTVDEEKALDPNDPTPGFETRKSLFDRVGELKTREAKLKNK